MVGTRRDTYVGSLLWNLMLHAHACPSRISKHDKMTLLTVVLFPLFTGKGIRLRFLEKLQGFIPQRRTNASASHIETPRKSVTITAKDKVDIERISVANYKTQTTVRPTPSNLCQSKTFDIVVYHDEPYFYVASG